MAKKVDANQADIVRALRQIGAQVELLHAVGKGVPDLLVSRAGRNYLMEVKAPKGHLNELQKAWHAQWKAPVYVVRTPEEALEVVSRKYR